jgi:uncharacterized protein YbcI
MFHADVVVVVLEKVLTPAEHSLVADGRGQAVVAMRASLHAAMVPSLASAVAGATSSRVHVTMGDTDHRADVAVEVFLLDRPVDPLRVAAPAG